GHPFLEREDDQGQKLPDDVNEGIRISAITKYLLGKMPGPPPEQQAVLRTVPRTKELLGKIAGLPPEQQALLRTAIDSSEGPVDGGRTLSSPRPGAGGEAFIHRMSTGGEHSDDDR